MDAKHNIHKLIINKQLLDPIHMTIFVILRQFHNFETFVYNFSNCFETIWTFFFTFYLYVILGSKIIFPHVLLLLTVIYILSDRIRRFWLQCGSFIPGSYSEYSQSCNAGVGQAIILRGQVAHPHSKITTSRF